MKNEVAGALLWLGTRTGIISKKVTSEKSAFEDGVLHEASAQIVGGIPFTGSKLSVAELALKTKLGQEGAVVHDAALIERLKGGHRLLTEIDVPLGGTPRED